MIVAAYWSFFSYENPLYKLTFDICHVCVCVRWVWRSGWWKITGLKLATSPCCRSIVLSAQTLASVYSNNVAWRNRLNRYCRSRSIAFHSPTACYARLDGLAVACWISHREVAGSNSEPFVPLNVPEVGGDLQIYSMVFWNNKILREENLLTG